jgi:hypothetical protein
MIKNLLLLIMFFLPLTVRAQFKAEGGMAGKGDFFITTEKSQIEALYSLFSEEILPAFELINGKEHFSYYDNSKYKPILFIYRAHIASVTVKGIRYVGLPVNYDTFHDRIIYGPIGSDSKKMYKIELNNEAIDGFTFYYTDDTLSFLNIRKGNNPDNGLSNGFYEVAYNGKSKYLIKHRSIEYFNNSIPEYEYKPDGYLNLGNGFIKIRSKAQFCSLFGEKEPEVRKFLRDSAINFRKANKRELNCILKYYDNLTKNN